MKILVLSHLYPRSSNPILGIFVHEQIKALLKKGYEVEVLSGEPYWINTFNPLKIYRALMAYRKTAVTWEVYDGVRVCYFPYVTGWISPFECHAFTYARGAERAVARLAIGVKSLVHAHTSFLDGTAARALKHRRGWPYVLTEHTGPFSELTKNWLRRRQTQRAVLEASHVLAVSPALRSDMLKDLQLDQPVEIHAVPNGVDTNLFAPMSAEPRGQEVRALWVGHHVPVKRVDVLLQAFQAAYLERPNLRLTLVGDGALKRVAEGCIEDLGLSGAVNLEPAMDRAQVASMMCEHDFLVISSETETFGVVAAEALSCGIPVLSTRCGGPESILDDDRTGMLVGKDAGSLAQGFVEMAQAVELGKFDAAFIRQRAIKLFSFDLVAVSLGSVYRASAV